MTGLIYLVIIALWAAVLIPMWLRRHDQISEVRSTTRFSTAMRSLGSPRSGETMANSRTAATARRSTAHERAAQRRTIVLGLLTALLAVSLLLAVASMVPKWLPVGAAVLVAAFVVATAMTASQRTAATASARAPRDEQRRPAERAAEVPNRAPAPVAQPAVDDWESWNAWDDDESWEAVPSTLPTYVNSPRASVIPRPIDRARPDEWNGTAMIEAASQMRRHQEAAAEPLVVDHRSDTAELPAVRAANG
ncbi:MAG: hypothetical protein PHU75_02665 [Candidatus Nanopelagicales bacterium]|nr:hypothetical protein [Candidatus Nanopelagicales bacterium]